MCQLPQQYDTTHVLYHTKKGYLYQSSKSTLDDLYEPEVEIFTYFKHREPPESLEICRQLAQCVQCLHKDDIIHGSISPGCVRWSDSRSMNPTSHINIALQHAGLYQIASREQTQMELSEATRYTAPEHLETDGFVPTKEGDVYGWAAVSYAILRGVPLFSGKSHKQCVVGIMACNWMERRLVQPEGVSSEVWQLLQDCLKRNAAARPSMSEVVRRLG